MLVFAEKYLAHLQTRNYSPETIERHRLQLKKWVAFCAKQGIQGLPEVTAKHIRDFQVYMYELRKKDGKPYHVASQNGTLEVVHCLLRWAFREELITTDPAKQIEYAKEPQRLPRSILTTTEMRRILNAPQTNTLLGYRDRTIMELLYSSMIRRAELNHLKLEDLDFENGVIRVNQGKGSKDRVVPMGKVAGRYLKHYIEKVRPELVQGEDSGHVFLSQEGHMLSRCMVWIAVKKYASKAGIAKNVFPHCFRATGLTHMLRNGAHVRHLMGIAGHASMEALNSYLAVEITDLKETHAKTHPRELEIGM